MLWGKNCFSLESLMTFCVYHWQNSRCTNEKMHHMGMHAGVPLNQLPARKSLVPVNYFLLYNSCTCSAAARQTTGVYEFFLSPFFTQRDCRCANWHYYQAIFRVMRTCQQGRERGKDRLLWCQFESGCFNIQSRCFNTHFILCCFSSEPRLYHPKVRQSVEHLHTFEMAQSKM